jgi:sugar lactone lactonase YvrE
MSNPSPMPEPKVLLDGLAYVESPRWHDGRLWFAHWGAGEIVAVDLADNSEIVGHGPPRRPRAAPGPVSAARRAAAPAHPARRNGGRP